MARLSSDTTVTIPTTVLDVMVGAKALPDAAPIAGAITAAATAKKQTHQMIRSCYFEEHEYVDKFIMLNIFCGCPQQL